MKIQFTFTTSLWQYTGKGAWYFVTVPQEMSKEIREIFRSDERGWGQLKATARIGNTEWQTAIWFDTKADAYLLPLKAEVRKKVKIGVGDEVAVTLFI